jgi:hypothetical protein
MKTTLTKELALIALTLTSGTVTANQAAKTPAELAIEQINECIDGLFKDDFEPPQVDYELNSSKEKILYLATKWGSRDNTISIMVNISSIGNSARKEIIMMQKGQSSDEPPPPAAKVKEYLGKVFEECPPQQEDYECADAVVERFNGIEQIVRRNPEYHNVTVEKYKSNEQVFRASKQVRVGIDDYYLILNGTTNHKSFEWRSFLPLTSAAVEEILHNPPPRVANYGSDIRKLPACMEKIDSHIRVVPR